MIVNDLDLESVAVRKFEAQTPSPIDRHRPLISPAALELVKSDASQVAQLVEIRRRIESCE
jgi:hypothetical protein